MDQFYDSAEPSSKLSWKKAEKLEQQRQKSLGLLDFYRRRVLFSKYVLPILAIALVALIVLWPQLHPESNRFRLGQIHSAKVDFSGDGLTVKNPRLVGVDDKDQPYTITAITAQKKTGEEGVVYLDAPKADITLKSGTWMIISSKTGTVNEKTNKTQFLDNVNLFQDEGYEMTGEILDVEMKTGNMQSAKPVFLKGPAGTLKAIGFDLSQNGKLLNFRGPATMILYPGVL